MTINNIEKKKLFITSMISVCFFAFLAHGYRFFNNMYSGDSLFTVYQNDSAWQIALGRIFQPIYIMFRGSWCNPWLISFLAIIFTGIAAYLMCSLLNINNPVFVILISGLFECNIAITCSNATYLPWVDIYALALLLAILGVYLIEKGISSLISNQTKRVNGILLCFAGAISITFSLGLYQAYVCEALSVAIILFIIKLTSCSSDKNSDKNYSLKNIFISMFTYLVSLLTAACMYYIAWKIFQKAFNIWTSDSYNGLASVGDYTGISIGALLTRTYRLVFDYFWNPQVFASLVFHEKSLSICWIYLLRLVFLASALFIVILIVRLNIKNKSSLSAKILQALLLIVFPAAMNFVCIISKGMVHTLMVFAFINVYILLIALVSNTFSISGPTSNSNKKCTCSYTIIASAMLIAVTLWNNIAFSNQVYLKKAFQDNAANALLNRIVYEIEHLESYEAGITPVAFYGLFEMSPYINENKDMEDIIPFGMGSSPLLYEDTDYAYLTYILNVNMNLTRINASADPDIAEYIANMPVYPAAGSIELIDGTVIVKISE